MSSSKPENQVNWEAVWRSLNWDDEQRQQAADSERLRQRAAHYAAPLKEQAVAAENSRSVLTFELGRERYGIDVMHVRGIRALGTLAEVPSTPSFYVGVINMRGQIISVLDLRRFFQIAFAEDAPDPLEVIVVHAGELEMALVAHQVIGVEGIPHTAIKPVDHMPYAHGLTSDKIVLLDMAQLFQDERLIIGGVSE
jgi:purine-binding chemotaxis protein CheW